MSWFVEEKNFRGEWVPAIYYSGEPPEEKRLDKTVKFKNKPVKIAKEHHGLSLREIQRIYRK